MLHNPIDRPKLGGWDLGVDVSTGTSMGSCLCFRLFSLFWEGVLFLLVGFAEGVLYVLTCM